VVPSPTLPQNDGRAICPLMRLRTLPSFTANEPSQPSKRTPRAEAAHRYSFTCRGKMSESPSAHIFAFTFIIISSVGLTSQDLQSLTLESADTTHFMAFDGALQVHEPYQAPLWWPNATAGVLRGMLKASDNWMGEIVSLLKSKAMWSNTLIFYSAGRCLRQIRTQMFMTVPLTPRL
jgi:hypothetical protein